MSSHDPRFTLLRRGSDTPAGPYSEDDILRFLQNKEVDRNDFVFFEGMEDWKPLEEVFNIEEQLSHFVDDGQDHARVAAAFREVSEILASDDEIYYIAVQQEGGLLDKGQHTIVLTEQQLMVLSEKKSGFEIDSHPWSTVQSTAIKEDGKGKGSFIVNLKNEKKLSYNRLPSAQTHRLFQLSNELN